MPVDPELYRRLVDASSGGLWLLDGEGNTLFSNSRMAELLGRTPEQMAGLNAYDVHDEQGRREFAAHLAMARSGDPGHDDIETRYLRLDGTPIWLLASWRPVHDDDGTTLGYLHQYSDYTDLRGLIEQLARREQQLATAQAIASIGSWEWDVVSDRTTWSDELYRIYGIDRSAFRGDLEAFLDFIHPDDRQHVRKAVATIYDGVDAFEWNARIVRGDGEERWCRGLGRVERGADGAPVRVNGTDQDVTTQVRADHELSEASRRLSLLRDVAEVANKSTVLTEALILTSRVIDRTPGWHLAWAVMPDDAAKDRPSLFPLSEDPELGHLPPDEALAQQAMRTGEVAFAPLAGHEDTHSYVAVPIRHSEDVVCVALAVGAETPPDAHSEDLIHQVSAMLGRVAERERSAAELAEARDQAMEASRLKSEFLATMSHEIRTPMNGVIGLTDLLMRTTLDDQQRRLAEALHGAGLTLRGIINDILDLSKIEAGKLELELVDFEVRSVVEQAVRLLRGLATEKGLDLRLSVAPRVPTYVRGDAVRWEQILANLGSNAVKFTDRGSVQVMVDVAERLPDGHLLEVVVQDTGPGIPDHAQRRLFDAFTQADPSTTRRHGGTGLGLTIVRQLVDALGGEIELRSEVGRGSSFRFTAAFGTAVGDAREGPAVPGGSVAAPAATHRVLVVEDNQVNQMVAVGLLESVGYATAVAVDGVEAVEALTGDHGFSAVLMDCRMPRMDGYTATRTIRDQEGPERRIPIIAMTASALEGERERCLACGMDDFLTKPVDSDRLHRTLRQWIGDEAATPAPAPSPPAPAPSPAPEAPQGDVVDTERIDMLHEMVKDGVSLFQRSSGNFIAHAADHLAAIGAAVDGADADALVASAHKLKGSALNLGLPRVGAAAHDLEERGRDGRLEGLPACYATLSREMGIALAALEQARAART